MPRKQDRGNPQVGSEGLRIERDALGEKMVPAEALYGIQTARAVENFPISGLRSHPALVRAMVLIKKAAALTNMATGRLDRRIGDAIVVAADEVLAGQWRDQFVVDVFQAGAGTSFNMNVNEVLANRSNELLGGRRGEYRLVHPNDHVNMAQSTNDTFPTAMRLAALLLLQALLAALRELADALRTKGVEFDDIVKPGRTHLQDAVPIRLGQEFAAYAFTLSQHAERVRTAGEGLEPLNIGATAAGTGTNAEPTYIAEMPGRLAELSGLPVRRAENLVALTQSMADFAAVSGALRNLALDLGRIANDLRLMSSGPHTGLGEINLPPVQPGSSIMPGKVNPVIPEMTNMVCFQVMGSDLVVSLAAQAGQLDLNVMMPAIAFNLLQSLEILRNTLVVFRERLVQGISANAEHCRQLVERSTALATALTPYIGYAAAAEIAKEAATTGKTVRQIVLERKLFPPQEVEGILSPMALTRPGLPGHQEQEKAKGSQ
jgi:aspartate ammonia-lyase